MAHFSPRGIHPWLSLFAGILLSASLIACNATSQPKQTASSPAPTLTPNQVTSPTPGVVSPQGDRTPATVISVGDGDTLTANQNGANITIRMACIDAPESAAPMGPESTARLRELLPRGTAITTRYVDRDRYNRTVAEVFVGNRSINLQLVKEGRVVVYRDYLSGCPNQQAFLTAESQAKKSRLAFWSQSNPIMPWDWRQGERSKVTSPTTQPSPLEQTHTKDCDPSYPDVCIPPAPPDLDCGDITYRRFTVRQPDPHRFDGDGNGIGCERG